eukprot:TRINITY_DN3133_c1_g1_i1.p1 TRINITY_DN3133_c1_g1~~TRINITY_DN3133_c1_g1_i1.p1  ORF type:complete len:298 (-),score=137.71 TRINITY_DN3133_c1_g1_i1:10-903(-)
MKQSAGKLLRNAWEANKPLQVVGTINAYSAILADKTGFQAIYLSGGGVAAASYGLPDLGITTINDVIEDVRRITRVTDVPLLVDVDTGFGGAFNISRTVEELIKAGAAGLHIEDQVAAKRCGHRPGKQIVTTEEMVDRIKAATDMRDKLDPNFVIMARTDALANEGMEGALERAHQYIDAGADALFPEALTTLEQYQSFSDEFPDIPILANITEFGKTPLFTKEELSDVGVGLILYPLSAFRAQAAASLKVYNAILNEGTQQSVVEIMQPRMELYDYLNYHDFEQKLDKLFGENKEK